MLHARLRKSQWGIPAERIYFHKLSFVCFRMRISLRTSSSSYVRPDTWRIANVANLSYAFMLAFLMQYQKRNSCCLISSDVTIKSTFCLHFFRINPRDLKIPLFLKANLRTCFIFLNCSWPLGSVSDLTL